jgi:hypothetical protein
MIDSIENGDNSVMTMSHRSSKATATIGLVVHAAGNVFNYVLEIIKILSLIEI